jgi:hypothetical protein
MPSEQVQVEETLRANEAQPRQITDNMPDLAFR